MQSRSQVARNYGSLMVNLKHTHRNFSTEIHSVFGTYVNCLNDGLALIEYSGFLWDPDGGFVEAPGWRHLTKGSPASMSLLFPSEWILPEFIILFVNVFFQNFTLDSALLPKDPTDLRPFTNSLSQMLLRALLHGSRDTSPVNI